ncbi:MAG: type II secretion system F family protein [Vicinamibacterales bacterium]
MPALGYIEIGTFLGVLAVVFGAYWFSVGEAEAREQRQLKRRLKTEDPSLARVSVASVQLLKQEQRLSSIDQLNAALASAAYLVNPIRKLIANSGLNLTVASFLLLTAVGFLGGAAAVNYYLPIAWVAIPVAFGTALIPYAVLRFFGTKRVRKFEEQFPEAIELIARALRAGHAFPTGIKIAADELPEPAGPEFRLLYERQNFGAPIPEALRAFAERVPTIDARFFVTAVLTQREAGGNLSEILDRLAGVMRERFRIRQDVRTRSAHGRVTAYVLAGMPPSLAALMMIANPKQMSILFTDPLGIKLVIVGVVLQVVGMIIIRRIVDIQY